jgi:hypothetical protein
LFFAGDREVLMHISDTTAVIVNIPAEIDDVLNEWIAEQRDPTLTKSVAINLALREWMIQRGILIPAGPLQQVEDEMLELVKRAFPEDAGQQSPGNDRVG